MLHCLESCNTQMQAISIWWNPVEKDAYFPPQIFLNTLTESQWMILNSPTADPFMIQAKSYKLQGWVSSWMLWVSTLHHFVVMHFDRMWWWIWASSDVLFPFWIMHISYFHLLFCLVQFSYPVYLFYACHQQINNQANTHDYVIMNILCHSGS